MLIDLELGFYHVCSPKNLSDKFELSAGVELCVYRFYATEYCMYSIVDAASQYYMRNNNWEADALYINTSQTIVDMSISVRAGNFTSYIRAKFAFAVNKWI